MYRLMFAALLPLMAQTRVGPDQLREGTPSTPIRFLTVTPTGFRALTIETSGGVTIDRDGDRLLIAAPKATLRITRAARAADGSYPVTAGCAVIRGGLLQEPGADYTQEAERIVPVGGWSDAAVVALCAQ